MLKGLFRAMIGNIDTGRIKFHKRVQLAVQAGNIGAPYRRQHFEGNKCTRSLSDLLCNFHDT